MQKEEKNWKNLLKFYQQIILISEQSLFKRTNVWHKDVIIIFYINKDVIIYIINMILFISFRFQKNPFFQIKILLQDI